MSICGSIRLSLDKLPYRCIRFRGVVWVIHFILLTEHKPMFSRLRIPLPQSMDTAPMQSSDFFTSWEIFLYAYRWGEFQSVGVRWQHPSNAQNLGTPITHSFFRISLVTNCVFHIFVKNSYATDWALDCSSRHLPEASIKRTSNALMHQFDASQLPIAHPNGAFRYRLAPS